MNKQEEIDALKKRLAELETPPVFRAVKISGEDYKVVGRIAIRNGKQRQVWDKQSKKRKSDYLPALNIIEVEKI